MNFEIKLDSVSKMLISLFESVGISAYAVGGCVRDSCIGRPVSDIDLAVSCTPDITKKVLEQNNIKCVETGMIHGTVTAVTGGKAYEITTFRSDGRYSDNRRPDSVSFVTDIYTDLARRDFTVNAMAYNPSAGLIDVFGGIDDIETKTIRAVGDADTRFTEDSLRILRALRFASVLDFEIEQNTRRSMLEKYTLLLNIARERVTDELIKLICGHAAGRIIREYSRIIMFAAGSPNRGSECKNCERLWHAIDLLPHDPDIRTAAFIIINCLKTDTDGAGEVNEAAADKMMTGLRLKSRTVQNIRRLSENFNNDLPDSRIAVKKQMSLLGAQFYISLLELRLAFCSALNDTCRCQLIRKNLDYVADIMKKNETYNTSQLEINGNDLKVMGFCNERIGAMLGKVLEAVIEQRLDNDRDSIIKYLTEYI